MLRIPINLDFSPAFAHLSSKSADSRLKLTTPINLVEVYFQKNQTFKFLLELLKLNKKGLNFRIESKLLRLHL